MYKSLRLALATCLMTLSASSFAAITVTDDLGNIVTLERPAQRVISLAPHVTELILRQVLEVKSSVPSPTAHREAETAKAHRG